MKRYTKVTLAFSLFLLFLIAPSILRSQSQEIKLAFESIAKITGNGTTDHTTELLKREGFDIPENLRSSWNKFPSYRKIETAYWAAENAGKGNGEKFITSITKKLAREFESVAHEASLARYASRPVEKFTFSSLTSLTLPADIPKSIAVPLLSITKYTDAKALGGTHGILKYYFDLNEEDVWRILRESSNDFGALIAGIQKATIPPSEKERLTRIVTDLRENYLAAKMDEELPKLLDLPDLIKEDKGAILTTRPQKAKLEAEYKHFVEKNHRDDASKKFESMRTNSKSFGGVILGNSIITSEELANPQKIIWIHEQDDNGINNTGRLELVFGNGKVKIMSGVLWEDVYAAYNIIYVDIKKASLDKGIGIGLVGASYPEIYREDRVYDSLVTSFKLTPKEMQYYTLLSNFSKFRDKYTKRIDSISSRVKEIEEIDRTLSRLDSIIGKAILQNKPYESDYIKGTQLENRKKQLITLAKPIYARYLKDTAVDYQYRETLKSFRKNDSLAVAHVHHYLSYCKKSIIHPAIANLELGRSLLRADVLPRLGSTLVAQIRSKGASTTEISLCEEWLQGSDSIGWKFTDDSLFISSRGDLIRITRKNSPDSIDSQLGLLNFIALRTDTGKSISEERLVFYQVAPVLTRTFYDYYRLNNFVKVLTLLRWANQSGARFMNKPKTPQLYKAPAYLKLTSEGKVIFIDSN